MSDLADVPDAALLSAAADGDGAAYAAFYRRHLPSVLSYFARRTDDRELAADLTAETFAAALLASPRYEPEQAPATAWLFGIASNKLRDSRRRGRVEGAARRRLAMERLEIGDADLERVDELVAGAPALEAVEALAPEQRDAVIARVVEERSYSEIAAALTCSEAVVRQRVSRGLTHLRTRLKGAP